MRARSRLRPLGLALCLALAYPAAQGLPQGAQVVQGQAKVSTPQAGQGLIQQASDKAVINWQSFSIGASETLRIEQPGVNSVLLNRVVGGDPSLILGRMQANGQVFLLNPHGIVFGRGSQVDVGGLVASTLDLSDNDFLAGIYRFTAGPVAGALQADGSITAPGGTVALLAPQLNVGGSIQARRVGLAAASTVQVDVEGDGLVLFNLRNDDDRDVALKFSGRILAEGGVAGGSAELRAQARAGAAGQVLNMDGVVQARGLRQAGGRIVIDGGTAGDTLVTGTLDATGDKGGSIAVLGQRVALLDGARLDASGRLGGGDLQVGGGFEGQGTDHNAQRTYIGAGAVLRADATEQGDGGRVAVWADGRTDMLGWISARGGSLGGNGGKVETSGRQQLNVPSGGVDVTAPRGRAGQWLLDPNDLDIVAGNGLTNVPGTGPDPFTTTDNSAALGVDVLNAALNNGTTVTVQTGNGGTNSQPGNITVQADIASTVANTLNLIASGSIAFNGGHINASGVALNVNMQAGGSVTGSSIATTGAVDVKAQGSVALGTVNSGALTIDSGGGSVTLPGGSVSALGVTTGGGVITQSGALTVTGNTTLTSGAGSVTLAGLDSAGLSITTTNAAVVLNTGTVNGALSVNSHGSTVTQSGALTVNLGSSIDAAGGDITLTSGNTLKGTVNLTGITTQVTNAGSQALLLGTLNTGDLTAITGGGGIQLGAGNVGALTAMSHGGAITQNGALTASGAASLTSGAGTVTLGTFSSASLGITTTNADVVLNTGTVNGTLGVSSQGGTVTQSGALIVNQGTSIDAAGGDITLTSGNTLKGTVNLTGGITQVTNAGSQALLLGTLNTGDLTAITGGGGIQLGAGNVGALTATSNGGAITQNGTLAASGAASLTSGAGVVTLGNFSSAGLGITTNNASVVLNTGTVDGALGVNSHGGTVTQSGALIVNLGTSIDAAGGDITLTSGNTLKGTINLTGFTTQVTNAGNQALLLGTLNTGDLTAITGGGDIQLGAGGVGALTATSHGGAITQSGALTAAGAASLISGAGTVTLGTFSSAGLGITTTNAAVQLGAGTISGTLNVGSSGGAITQNGALTTTGAATLAAGAGTVTLGSFSSAGLDITTTNAAVVLNTGTVDGALSVNSHGGTVTQSGALTVNLGSSIDAGAGDITLTSGNTLKGTVNLTGGITQVTNAGSQALLLGTLNTTGDLTAITGGGGLQLGTGSVVGLTATSNGGAITQNGALTATGAATLTAGAGSVTLGTFSSGALDIITTNAAIQLGAGTVTGTLHANSHGGAITQAAGSLTVTTDATLTAGGGLVTLGSFGSRDLDITTSNAAVTLGVGSLSGVLTVHSNGGAIQQAGALTVNGAATLAAAGGAVSLGTFSSGNLGITTTNAGIQLGAGTITGTLNANSGSGSGAITQAAGSLTVTTDATLTAGTGGVTLGSFGSRDLDITTSNGGVTLGIGTLTRTLTVHSNGGAIQQAGALTVNGAATLAAAGGAVTLGTFSSGNLDITTTNAAIQLGAGTVSGTLNASSGGGAITQNGALTATGAATLTGGAGSVTLGNFSSAGLDVTTTNAAVVLGAGTIDGALSVNSHGGTVTQAGAMTVNLGSSINAGTGAGAGGITLTSGNTLKGTVDVTGGTTQVTNAGSQALLLGTLNTGNLTAITGGGDIQLGAGNVGALTATSNGGAITQSGALTATGAATLTSGAGTVTLGSFSSAGLDITTTNAAVVLNTGTVNGALSVNSHGGAVTQSGALTVNQGSSIDAGGGDITLTAANTLKGTINLTGGITQVTNAGSQALLLGTLSTGGDLTAITGGGGIQLGSGSVGGILQATSNGGAITQAAGTLTVTGDATLAAGGGSITLGSLNTGVLDVSTTNAAIRLGTGTVTGTLNANSGNGAITQASGGLTVTGTSTLDAGTAGNITLDDDHNHWTGVTIRGNSLNLHSAGDLEILGLTQPNNRALTLAAQGNLLLSATDIDTGTANLSLTSLGGSFTAGGKLSGKDITVKAHAGLVLAHDVTATGNLVLSTDIDDVSQTGGAIKVTGTTAVTAGTSVIDLAKTGNLFQGAVSLTGGISEVVNSDVLTLGTLSTGNLKVTSHGDLKLGQGTVTGTLEAKSNGGKITQTGALTLTGAIKLDAGSADITLGTTGNDLQGNITAIGGGVTLKTAHDLHLFALTQPANKALVLEAGGTLYLPAGTTNIDTGSADLTLSSLGGVFATFGTLKGGNVTLGGQAVTFGHDVTAGGALVVKSTSGVINQTGGRISVTGTSEFDAGIRTITLGSALNDFHGAVKLTGGTTQLRTQHGLSLSTLATGALQLQAGGALDMGTGTVGGALDVSSNGAITQTGRLSVTGSSVFNAGGGDITLVDATNSWTGAVSLTGGAAQLRGAGAMALGGGNVASLVLTSGGAVTQNAAIGVSGALTVNAGGAGIDLSRSGNQLGGTVTLTGGTTLLSSAGSLTLGSLSTGALTVASAGVLNLGQGSVAGDLVANSGGGAITQSGTLNVSGATNLEAGGGAISLNQGGNRWGGLLNLSGGNTQVLSNGGLTLGTLAVGALSVDATGALILGQGTVGGALVANSHGGAITQSGALNVTGSANLQAGGGSITMLQASNRWGGPVQFGGSTVQFNSAGALTLGSFTATGLNLTSAGALGLGQGSVTGDLVAASGGGAVTQSGPLVVGGRTTINAGSGDITLLDPGNRLQGPLSLTGGAVALYNQSSITLATLNFSSLNATSAGSVILGTGSLSGSLTARALGGSITQVAGGISVGGDATLQALSGITLTDTANHLQGLVNLNGGAMALNNAGDLQLGSFTTAGLTLNTTGKLGLGAGTVNGDLSATSSGAVTQTGALVVRGATHILAGNAGITLGQAGNQFAGPVDLSGGNTLIASGGALSLGNLDVADLTVSSSGALRLGTGTVGGRLDATSGGGITQANGGLMVAGSAKLLATAGNITLGSFNSAGLDVSAANGAITLGTGRIDGTLTATSSGAITQASGGLTVTGSAKLTATAGNVTLGSFNSASLDVSAANGSITLGTGRIDGALTASSGGAITQASGGLTVTGSAKLTATAGDITLGSFNSAGLDVSAANGAITLGTGRIDGALTASSGRAITQASGGLTVAGPAKLSATAGDITLGSFNSAGLDVSATKGSITLGTGRIDGALTASSSGAITQASGGLTVTGSAKLAATAGDITLGSFNSAGLDVSATKGSITLGTGLIDGALNASSGGAITQASGGLTVTGPAKLSATAGDITLGTFSSAGLDASATKGAITLGTGRIDGALTASSGGAITQASGGLTVTGPAKLSATVGDITLGNFSSAGLDVSATKGSITLGTGLIDGVLTASSGGAITQDNRGLTVTGNASLLATAGDITLGSFNSAGLDVFTVNGSITLGTGRINGALTATSGKAIKQAGGGLDVTGSATLLATAGDVMLGSFNSAGLDVFAANGAITLGTGRIDGALTATSSGGAIAQAAGGLLVSGPARFDAGSAGIQLNDTANAFAGTVSLFGGDVSLVNLGALQLGSFVTHDLKLSAGGDLDLGAGTVNGVLTALTRGTRIGQSGALTVKGLANFIADGGLVSLVLDQPGNQLTGGINMLGINGGGFAGANISSTQDLTFSGDVQNLLLNAGGLLTLGGGHSDTLIASAKNGIVQTGPLVVSGLTTLIANGGAAMPVDLATAGAGNDFNGVVLKSQAGGSFGRVQLRDDDAARHDGLRVSGDAASLEILSAGALDLGGGSYGALLADTAVTGAAISQSGVLTVTGLATLRAGSGSVGLAQAGNRLSSLAVGSAGVASIVSASDYTVNAGAVSTRLELGGPAAIRLVGPLSGAGELVMSGSGSLTVSTAQAYGGGTRIQSGRFVLQGQAAQAGSGGVQLGAAGELDLRDGAVLANSLVAQGGSVLNSSGAGALNGPVTLQAPTTFLPGAGGLTVNGAISDGGAGFGLRLGGAGTLTLAGSNQYGGSTDIAAGTLQANGAGALPSTSAVQLAAGATLSLGRDQAIGSLSGAGQVQLGSFTLTTGADGRDTTFSGNLAGSGGLTKLGAGHFTLAGNGTQTGATRVAAGEVVLASSGALNAITAVTVDAGATLTVQQSASFGSLAGSGIVDLQAPLLSVGSNGGSTRFDGAISGIGGLAKLGGGVFTLAGHNTLAGDLQVNGGTLQLDGSSAPRAAAAGRAVTAAVVPATAGVSVAGGATLELLSAQELGALSGSGRVLLNPYTLTLGASGRDGRFDGIISGSGGLTKAGSGTLTLGGANLYTGATHVGGGTLALVAAKALAIDSALVIDAPAKVTVSAQQAVASLNGAGGLELNGASLAAGADGRDSRFDGIVSGSGGLVKQGAGAMTLTAASSNSGTTVIEAGTVRLAGSGSLGTGEIQNQGVLSLERSDAFTLGQAITGRGSLVVMQGQVTLANGGNSYGGATQVLGGSLITTAAERLPDASAVQVAAGAQLQLGGNETIASLQAAGSVRLAGNLTTRAEQVYTGSLTLANAAGLTLSGTVIDASRSANQFAGTPLSLNGGQALVTVKENLQLGDVTLSAGGRIEAQRLALDGKLQVNGGSLSLVATAAPDDAKATPLGTAQVPVSGSVLAVAEATVQQGSAGVITVAEGAKLQVQASGGGSVLLAQDANNFNGQLSVLSGAAYDTAWSPNVKGTQGVQSMVRVAGQQVMVGGNGIEADLVHIRADQLATVDTARLVARLPFDEIVLGRALSAPGMTLELAPGAFGLAGSFGSISGQSIRVVVGALETGGRTTGPNAGYLTVLPKGGAQGATAVVLSGPLVGSVPATGGPGYRFFHDGASQATEIPVVYNGVLPLTPSASGAISSINGDVEDARRARFQETVRTENVTVRLRSGVIAEVGPGRPSTQGSEGAKPPELCDPAAQPPLSCKPLKP